MKNIHKPAGKNLQPVLQSQKLHLHTCNLSPALFSGPNVTLLLIQVHFAPSIGSMWVLIKAVSDFISFPTSQMFARGFFSPSAIYEYALIQNKQIQHVILSWARHTINDSYKDNFKIFLQLINKFATQAKFGQAVNGLAVGRKALQIRN